MWCEDRSDVNTRSRLWVEAGGRKSGRAGEVVKVGRRVRCIEVREREPCRCMDSKGETAVAVSTHWRLRAAEI